MNEMVVKVIGSNSIQPEDFHTHNPGGFGANGSGNTAFTKF